MKRDPMASDPIAPDTGKRKLIKALGAGGAVGLGLKTGVIPPSWVKPVIDSVIPSAHAQTSVTPTPSPTAVSAQAVPAARAVPVASSGIIAVVAGALGYLGIRRLRQGARARDQH